MRGKPFEPGNHAGKGRPSGSRNKKNVFQEALESHGEAIINQLKVQALKPNPDPTALRLCVERLLPTCKAPNSRFPLPAVVTPADLNRALSAVTKAIANGRISAQEGEAIARILESRRRTFDSMEIDARLQALELKGRKRK